MQCFLQRTDGEREMLPRSGGGGWRRWPAVALACVCTLLPTLGRTDEPEPESDGYARAIRIRQEGVSVGEWTADWNAAKALAKERDLPLLVYFSGSGWCPLCTQVEETVFSTTIWRDYAEEKIVLVNVDVPARRALTGNSGGGIGDWLRKRFGISSYPQFVLVSPDGAKEVGTFSLERGMDEFGFIARVGGALRHWEGGVDTIFPGGGAETERTAYTELVGQLRKAEEDFDQWLAGKPENTAANQRRLRTQLETIAALEAKLREREIDSLVQTFAGRAEENEDRAKGHLESAHRYVEALRSLETAVGEMEDWLCGRPAPTAANQQRYQQMRSRLSGALEAARALE